MFNHAGNGRRRQEQIKGRTLLNLQRILGISMIEACENLRTELSASPQGRGKRAADCLNGASLFGSSVSEEKGRARAARRPIFSARAPKGERRSERLNPSVNRFVIAPCLWRRFQFSRKAFLQPRLRSLKCRRYSIEESDKF